MRRFITGALALTYITLAFAQADLKSNLKKLANVYWLIDSEYVDSVDYNKITEKAIIATLSELDPHSSYLTAKEVKASNESLGGSFEGIGITYNVIEDTLVVIQTIADGPSEKVGIMAGDRFIEVNDTTIAGVKFSNEELMRRIRGKKGSKVSIKVLRDGDIVNFTVTRDKIPVYSVIATYMATPEIGYIKIDRFAATTHDEVCEAITKLKKQGMKKLIIDLQSNGGGYLRSATDIADEFLSKNKPLLYTEGMHRDIAQYSTSGVHKGLWEDEPLVVLIDQYSASASEILSGALQDWDRAVIVGVRSFGKGLVQQPYNLADGSQIRITIARYHTPSGRCIQKPYTDGKDDYEQEAYNRYKSGELVSADSIQFADSLKYRTLSMGRTVYGGGGIMPDIFVPADTTTLNKLGRKLANSTIINKSCNTYVQSNKNRLRKYNDVEDFNNNFDAQQVFPLIRAGLADKDIQFNEEEWKAEEDFITLRVKSLIARDIWGSEAMWKVCNMKDRKFEAAIRILEDDQKYNSILGK